MHRTKRNKEGRSVN